MVVPDRREGAVAGATEHPIWLPARELAARIARGEFSAREAVAASLARIEAVNPRLNAFCFVYPEEALAEADAADAARARGEPPTALRGVPIAVKDFTPTAGKRTTRGSAALEHWVPDADPVVVRRLREAGAILVGKTTTPEFAHASWTHSPLWGHTRNPWDPSRTPGGSSGGAGVAVATGCVPLAEGTDMGGSVRIPAAWCGVVGLKPSLGRIPMDIVGTCFDQISHFGPLARGVDDAALFLEVTQGPDDADIQSLPAGTEALSTLPEDPKDWRIALSIDLGFCAVHPEVEARVRDAARALREAGAVVEEVELGWTRAVQDGWLVLWQVYFAALVGEHLERWRERMDPEVVKLIEAGRRVDAAGYKRLELERTRQWHRLAAVLGRHHALLCPTMAQPPQPVGGVDSDWGGDLPDGRAAFLDMTACFNGFAQCPALSVPCGFTGGGLPVGAQAVGRRFEDRSVLRVGALIERALGLGVRRPPI
jgi:Asp-tRNA(Asn)/Glu-tRNA(Gln) amidotransferase A subunit family amidase